MAEKMTEADRLRAMVVGDERVIEGLKEAVANYISIQTHIHAWATREEVVKGYHNKHGGQPYGEAVDGYMHAMGEVKDLLDSPVEAVKTQFLSVTKVDHTQLGPSWEYHIIAFGGSKPEHELGDELWLVKVKL